jgi:flagellar protein FlaG
MIDITKFAAQAQTNQSAQPVDPVRQGLGAGQESRRQTEEAIAAAKAQATSGEKPTNDEIEQAAKQVNDVLRTMNLSLNISVDEATNIYITKIIDDETGETVKQFPPDQIVEIAGRLQEMVVGAFVDEKT